MQLFAGIEYISNVPFFVCYAIIVFTASLALTLFLNLILNKKQTQLIVAILTLVYFAYIIEGGAGKTTISNSPLSYVFYILSVTFAIALGLSAGLKIRKLVKHLALSIKKKPVKHKSLIRLIIIITLVALVYDVYYILTAGNKNQKIDNGNKNYKFLKLPEKNSPYFELFEFKNVKTEPW